MAAMPGLSESITGSFSVQPVRMSACSRSVAAFSGSVGTAQMSTARMASSASVVRFAHPVPVIIAWRWAASICSRK